jgi:hypothetical protein
MTEEHVQQGPLPCPAVPGRTLNRNYVPALLNRTVKLTSPEHLNLCLFQGNGVVAPCSVEASSVGYHALLNP